MGQLQITPEPTDSEAAAIAAALTVATAAVAESTEAPSARWRFSGRWWSAPVSVRRSRP
jgi:hypothetical protein